MSLKSGDQWTVPLCRRDHDSVENSGDERRWWYERGLDPAPLAMELWGMTVKAGRAGKE